MARPRGKITAVCQNKECTFYRREKGKDIIKRGYNSSGTQMYKCIHCKKYLSETKGTPMFRRRLNERKVKQLCKLLIEKNGVRSVSRLTKLNKNTIVAWTHAAIKRGSYFFVAYSVGKRTQEKCREMMTQFANRIDLPTFSYRLE